MPAALGQQSPYLLSKLVSWSKYFSVQAAVLDGLGDVRRLHGRGTRQVGDRAGDLQHPNKALLYVEHEFEECVPQMIIGWEELATIGA